MVEVKVPELAESITEGTIAKWLKNVGEKVNKGDDIVELETDKVNVQISAEDEGVLTELKKEEGDTVEVGEVIAVLDPNAAAGAPAASTTEASEPAAPAEPKAAEAVSAAEAPATNERYVASPAVRKLARELGVDLKDVSTNDPLGRIHGDDVKRAAQPAPTPKAAEKPAANSDSNPAKPVERIKM